MSKILIVDDSRTSRKILRGIIEDAGYEVVDEAKNGEEGFLKYKELKPDLITMDITMPVMDGIEALKLIKGKFPEAKIIMVTAAGQTHNMKEAIESGADDFLPKPFEVDAIKTTLAKYLKA